MRIGLSGLPSPPKEYVVEFPRLDGGLNTWELDYRLKNNESPEMLNLRWQDGALCCRDGQTRLTAESLGVGFSAYETLFWDHGFFHIGDKLYCAKLTDADKAEGKLRLVELLDRVPENRGSWFRFGDDLFYKNRGGYYRIQNSVSEGLSVSEVAGYEPVIQINTEPTTAAGDAYQPENRISPVKTVWYTAVKDVTEYRLPVEADSVKLVTVDGERYYLKGDPEAPSTAKFYSLNEGKTAVLFEVAPEEHDPVVANTVKITYSAENPDAMASVMDCPHAISFGGNQGLCVVMGGCEKQPNAYFWSGHNIAMDPGYFPISQYNFAGAAEEKITGFGKQQNMLVIFKEGSVGRAEMSTEEMASGRVLIAMDYTAINSRIGCDLPHTIQLVENNLVFANRKQGVHMVADSSAAYENNIVPISRKVDNELLKLLRKGGEAVSFDDGERYWIVAEGMAFCWGYALSGYRDPSWFKLDNIGGRAFLESGGVKFQLTAEGHVDSYRRIFADYGEAIRKKYRFATQQFGGYDRLKDVQAVIFAVRGDTDTDIRITYATDYEEREDLTHIRSFTWRLSPRNLKYRNLGVTRFATVARRRPCCRHVRHFAMALENRELGQDMSVISAQIHYNFQGRDR